MTISPIYQDVLKNIPSVSELTIKIRTTLEKEFHAAVCFGEISNFKIPNSGHAYFTLKDENASIRVVMFKGQLQKLTYPLKTECR